MKKYFLRANTAEGCVNLIDKNLGDIKNVCILKGESSEAKRKILTELSKLREDCECVYSPFGINKTEVVFFRDIKTAVLDEELSGEVTGEIIQCAGEAGINLEEKRRAKSFLEEFYRAYREAKVIHDEWEKIYIERMDFARLESYSDGIISQIAENKKGGKGTYKYERFFGASTPDGSVNYIENLTSGLERRYFIKGRPGTGKSTFLKKLAAAMQERGFGCQVYYCSFDRNSLDMVLVPELSFCVFDSTAPHELFPERSGDIILDFYTESGLDGTDEEMAAELSEVSYRYKRKISEGLCFLRLAEHYLKERENVEEGYAEEMAKKIYKRIIA